jgi:histidinol-phosphatase
LNADLRLAMSLADEADTITMKFYESDALSVRTKKDRSPVSEADEKAETILRETLRRERPADGVIGEEFGVTGSGSRRWILDPIDGTRNYVRGVPVWATLIALEEDGRVSVGVVSAPAMKRRWWASTGEGAFADGRRIKVSTIDKVSSAYIGYPSISDFDARGLGEPILQLLRACDRSRGFGDFWQHMLVASGAIDVAIEPVVALWDMAAVQIIVEEAGGRFSSLKGEPRPDAGNALSTNNRLHEEVLSYFR